MSISEKLKSKTKNKDAGFTLIELLVVISIIGLLSSVVLASLNTARDRAQIAAGQQFDGHTYRAYGAEAIGIWNFDEGTGSTAYDSSGNGKTGTISGASWVSGMIRGALQFSGSSGSRVVTSNVSNGQNITISAWVNISALSSAGGNGTTIISKSPYNNQWTLFYMGGSNPQIQLRGSTDGSNMIACNTSLSLGKWYNVAATASANNAAIYVNGKICSTSSTFAGVGVADGEIIIGGSTYGGLYYNGIIDEVRVYSQSLLASDIEQIYAEGAEKYRFAQAD